MPRSLLLIVLAATLAFAAACGGGDSKPNTAPTSTATSERAGNEPEATATADDEGVDDDDTSVGESGLSSIFGSVLGGGLSGGAGAVGTGDPELKRFLPAASDFPDGYTPFGEFTFSSPDGISADGKIDIAMTMAIAGDVTQEQPDLSKMGIIMAMVMKPEDLQDLGSTFDDLKDLDKEDIEAEIEAGLGDLEGFDLQDWQVLDADGLGEGGFGIQMTMGLGQFADIFGGAGAGADMPEAMTMRMYMFAQGDHMAATIRMSFSDSLPSDSDERGIAEAIVAKLKAE